MNSLEQTRSMINELNKKLEEELENLTEGFLQMDFALITEASRSLNLFAHRGYDLATEKTYARFKRTTREEFMRKIQPEFLANGIDMRIPEDISTGGEAIYFYAFGERLGVLYGESKSLHMDANDPEFFDNRLAGKESSVLKLNEEIADLDTNITMFNRLLEKPSLILTKEFHEERKSKYMKRFKVRSKTNIFFYNLKQRLFAKLYERANARKIIEGLESEEGRARLESHVKGDEAEKLKLIERIGLLELEIAQLKSNQNDFKHLLQAFLDLLKKYNIQFSDRN